MDILTTVVDKVVILEAEPCPTSASIEDCQLDARSTRSGAPPDIVQDPLRSTCAGGSRKPRV
jgi:hypothetical protein